MRPFALCFWIDLFSRTSTRDDRRKRLDLSSQAHLRGWHAFYPSGPEGITLRMCGRFTRQYTWREIWELYQLTSTPSNIQPRFNICPTTTVDVVILGDDKRALVPMRWGLIPNWWKKPLKEMRLATFNARAETIGEKPMFRDSFKRRRCLMPVSGYYEWHTTPEGKQPYYFTRRDGQVMTIAAIQDAWIDP